MISTSGVKNQSLGVSTYESTKARIVITITRNTMFHLNAFSITPNQVKAYNPYFSIFRYKVVLPNPSSLAALLMFPLFFFMASAMVLRSSSDRLVVVSTAFAR